MPIFNNPGVYNAHPPVENMMVKDGQYVFNPPAPQSGSSELSWSPFDYFEDYFGRMNDIAQANNAASAAQAAELRSWQERQNRIAMDFNAAEAAKNRNWQQMMSNTAHQREVADLVAAGLNPVLSATGGNGAAVTSGATASGVTSAGAKGEIDTSQNQGLASLLGNMLTAQTSLLNTMVNAQNNMAIAEKNNAMSKYIALLTAGNNYSIAELNRDASIFQSLTSAETSRYSSDRAFEASRLAAYLSYLSYIYGSDRSYQAQQMFPNTWAAIFDRLLENAGLGPSTHPESAVTAIPALLDKPAVRNAIENVSPSDAAAIALSAVTAVPAVLRSHDHKPTDLTTELGFRKTASPRLKKKYAWQIVNKSLW